MVGMREGRSLTNPTGSAGECTATEPTSRVPDKSKASPTVTSGFVSLNMIHSHAPERQAQRLEKVERRSDGGTAVTLECHFHGMSISEDNML